MESHRFLHTALLFILLNTRLSVAAGSGGDDFTNNLFTDLAPLLGLFGEQFTKQFLSESFTFQERILFAMAPLGVLTAIVGAIRVGGASWLKRLIGRARENFAEVEIELMSCVSKEVCELWNGTSIVRSRGNPQVKQIIHLPAEKGDTSSESFITLDSDTWSNKYRLTASDKIDKHTKLESFAKWLRKRSSEPSSESADCRIKNRKFDVEASNLQNNDHISGDAGSSSGSMLDSQKSKDMADDEHKNMPPNISFNIHNRSNSIEVTIFAVVATGLQIGVLIWSWYVKRHKWSASKPVAGLWLQTIGTVILTLSLIICAGIIDDGSRERHWSKEDYKGKASPRRDMQLYWLQKQHVAGDNNFNSYVLYAEELTDHVFESHRLQSRREKRSHSIKHNQKPKKKLLELLSLKKVPWPSVQNLTTSAVILGISGFVAQFQGLRFSNWTCSVGQLIAFAIATCLRALVRRNMIRTPGSVRVNNNHLLDHLTLTIIDNGLNGSQSSISEALHSPGLSFSFGVTTVPKLRPIFRTRARPESELLHRGNPEPPSLGSQSSTNTRRSQGAAEKPCLAQQALDLRVRLGQITKWSGPKTEEAVMLSNSIETALKTLNPQLPVDNEYAIALQVNTGQNKSRAASASRPNDHGEVELAIMQDGDKWKVNDSQLEALLSLVSFSTLATKQKRNGKNQEETGGEKRSQTVENRQSIGWLRAKAPDMQTYEKVIGKFSPKLVSDLSWWIVDGLQGLMEVKVVDESHKPIEPLALGLYVNTENSKESNSFLISKCTERQALILHLFSAFIWAITEYISVQDLHPAEMVRNYTISSSNTMDSPATLEALSLSLDYGSSGAEEIRHHIKSNKIENLVQELQGMRLGTSKEIYQVLIPPLSHFDKLPNEVMADWCNESLIVREKCMFSMKTFDGYLELIKTVQDRGVLDRFANRTAAIIIGFLFRVHGDLSAKIVERNLTGFNENLKKIMKEQNKTFLISVQSLMPILKRQHKIKNMDRILTKIEFQDFWLEPPPITHTLKGNDFTFPNSTDVFGWTKEYWEIFDGKFPFNEDSYKRLDIAGQSVLHNAFDWLEDNSSTGLMCFRDVLLRFVYYNLFQDRELMTAICDKQTPLHRAARINRSEIVRDVLRYETVPCAADFFGRTALCFAAHHGNAEVVDMLCEKMKNNINQKDVEGHNALFYAILNHHEKVALNLMERRINSTDPDPWNRTPFEYAVGEGMEKVVKLLLDRNEIQIYNTGSSHEESLNWIVAKRKARSSGHKKIVEILEEYERKQAELEDFDSNRTQLI